MNTTGFPSPAQGYEEKTIDFNSLLVKNQSSTFCMRYVGKGILSHFVKSGDILIVDCSLLPDIDSLVVVRTCDGFQCYPIIKKRRVKNSFSFMYLGDDGKSHLINEYFGVVKAVIRLFDKK